MLLQRKPEMFTIQIPIVRNTVKVTISLPLDVGAGLLLDLQIVKRQDERSTATAYLPGGDGDLKMSLILLTSKLIW